MRKIQVKRRLVSQKGFTLIELMAVLAILAIILAIAVPSIGKLLDKSAQSADDSAIDLIEHAGENAFVDDLEHDTVVTPTGDDLFTVPEKDSYSVPTLVDKGYLKLDKDSKFYAPGEYVTKKNKGGEYVYKGEAGAGGSEPDAAAPPEDGGFAVEIDQILSCEAAFAAGYDYCIKTPEELALVGNAPNAKYIVMNNIVVNPGWVPIGSAGAPFGGLFNGNGYDLIGLDATFAALLIGGTIENVRLVDAVVDGVMNVGALVGQGHSSATPPRIDNVVVMADVTGTGQYVGGLIGQMTDTGTISNSCVSGTVTSSAGTVGGLIGSSYATITDSCSTATVTANGDNVGGLIGHGGTTGGGNNYATGSVTNSGNNTGGLIGESRSALVLSYATGAVSSEGKNAGGLVGKHDSGVLDVVYATGSVSADGSTDSASNHGVGGLIGLSSSTVMNAYATGDVFTEGVRAGGAIGQSTSATTNISATGDVEGLGGLVGGLIGDSSADLNGGFATGTVRSTGSLVGGLIGQSNMDLVGEIYATGDVVAGGDNVGGLVGLLNGDVSPGSYAEGTVDAGGNKVGGLIGAYSGGALTGVQATGDVISGGDYTGGLVGDNYGGVVEKSSYIGTIDAGGSYVGGLTGLVEDTISDSYAIADITAPGEYVGGLAGFTSGSSIVNSYASGTLSGDPYAGAILGGHASSITPMAINSYWNNDLVASANFGEGRSASQLQDKATFTGWDFDSIWKIESGKMPELR